MLGQSLISPILIVSWKNDLQTTYHLSEKIAFTISLAMVFIAGIAMVLATTAIYNSKNGQEEKEYLPDRCPFFHKLFGNTILICTGIIGGSFSTYYGLSNLGWLPHSHFLRMLWSGLTALYWVAFYRGVLAQDYYKHSCFCCYIASIFINKFRNQQNTVVQNEEINNHASQKEDPEFENLIR